MQSDLQHKKHETFTGIINEGHDETVNISESAPMGYVKGFVYINENREENITCKIIFSSTMNILQYPMTMRNG